MESSLRLAVSPHRSPLQVPLHTSALIFSFSFYLFKSWSLIRWAARSAGGKKGTKHASLSTELYFLTLLLVTRKATAASGALNKLGSRGLEPKDAQVENTVPPLNSSTGFFLMFDVRCFSHPYKLHPNGSASPILLHSIRHKLFYNRRLPLKKRQGGTVGLHQFFCLHQSPNI